ncbi:MAG: PASTA domain-containing protein [Prevotellaceae bacterium]|nr:PASTA domain-containing protein [Prevotella sp.]MDD7256833.1 PASTA domain-containing protein [Prevotellaceae bacterium]MDY6131664.1 PASTA domain-containing protein [Prevotella sp.]
MESSVFFRKIFGLNLWLNLFAMLFLVVALCFGVKYSLDLYTHHGEKISVPNIRHKSYYDAEKILESMGLKIEVSDTGYVKSLPPDCILEQSVMPGDIVKSGRTVYVTINASDTPTLTLPDIIDNSSYREARAKLVAMGLKVGEPEYVSGERDWVYGVKCKGRMVSNGQKVPVDALLIIQVGDGMRSLNDSVAYMDKGYDEFDEVNGEENTDTRKENTEATGSGENGDVDDFEEVTGP